MSMKVKTKTSDVTVTLTAATIKGAVKTYTLSKRYINTMLRASLINILYHRFQIDEDQFVNKKFNKVPYKAFAERPDNIIVQQFYSYMLACKDALDKDYLKEVHLHFVDVNTDEIIENYKFSFKYSEDKMKPAVQQKQEDLTGLTTSFLEVLRDLSNLEKLQSNLLIKIELTYHEGTPRDYEPPGFEPTRQEDCYMKRIPSKGNSAVFGSLYTGFHRMNVRVRGDRFNDSDSIISQLAANQDVIMDNNEGQQQQKKTAVIDLLTEDLSANVNGTNKEQFTEDDRSVCFVENIEDEEIEEVPAKKQKKSDFNVTHLTSCSSEATSTNAFPDVSCLCRLTDTESVLDILACAECKKIYHVPCQGYLDPTFISGAFVCSSCSKDAASCRSGTVSKARFLMGLLYKMKTIPKRFHSVVLSTFNVSPESLLEDMGNENGKFSENTKSMFRGLFKFDSKKLE